MTASVEIRRAEKTDLPALVQIEQICFKADRISERSFRRWLKADTGLLWLVALEQKPVGYGLVIIHNGTRLARLYSLAMLPETRGQGLTQQLLQRLENLAIEHGKLYMRLEVAKNNSAAISLYEKLNYRVFGEYAEYYDDHSDALRMQKILRPWQPVANVSTAPWYGQTLDFTCGPAALMMAMAGLNNAIELNQLLEIDLWREATTIFMTSGHGGTHPVGLALAAAKRGFNAQVFLNVEQAPFLDGVRSLEKKAIMSKVHDHFIAQAQAQQIDIQYQQISLNQIEQAIQAGQAVLCLISTYQFDSRKAPHWVLLTHIDDRCIYFHDPDVGSHQVAVDCQHVPVALADFESISVFGRERLRTSIVLSWKP